MKKQMLILVISLSFHALRAQQTKQKIAVVGIERVNATGSSTSENLASMVAMELEKIESFEVLDKYDIRSSLKNLNINPEDCYGKTCILQVGKAIGANKMLGGLVETYPKKMVVNLRLIDVESGQLERQQVKEFNVVPLEVNSMIEISVKSMFGQKIDSLLNRRLTQTEGFDNAVTLPNVQRLKAEGPRMGVALITGQIANIMTRKGNDGGFNAHPYLFQFGYQFETEYLNAGKYQALFEFIPMVSGLDQGLFLPSVTVINGLRNNINGWEIGIGPIFRITTQANGQWVDGQFLIDQNVADVPYEKRLDSRGKPALSTAVVIAAGKTLRSGKLNLPINAYMIPGKDSWQFGLSFGFNASR